LLALLVCAAFVGVSSVLAASAVAAQTTAQLLGIQSSWPSLNQPVCHEYFQASSGRIEFYPQNRLGAVTVVSVVSGSDLSGPSGYILFGSGSQHSDTWETTSIGVQNYSVSASGELVGGYLTCYTDASLFLENFSSTAALSAQTARGWTTYLNANGPQTLLIAACDVYSSSGNAGPCGPFSVNGSKTAALQYQSDDASTTFYYEVINGSQTVVLNMAAPNSSMAYEDVYLFVYSVSHSLYGWIKGQVRPLDAKVVVNDTAINLTDGFLNLSLPYGFYEVNVSAHGYNNLSVVVEVYAGVTTPLSVALSTREQAIYLAMMKLLNVAVVALGASVILMLTVLSLFPNKFYRNGFSQY
jgi:hypothetical protein